VTMDMIVLAGAIHNDENPSAQALGISGERISALGSRADAARWSSADTRVVDLGDAVITAGLSDPHAHPLTGLEWTSGLDLKQVTDADGLAEALTTACAATDPDSWVLGWNLVPQVLGDVDDAAGFLDRVCGGRKVFLRLHDGGHSAYASRAALSYANVTGPVDLGPLAEVECDEDGRPTGGIHEEAVDLVGNVVPQPPHSERVAAARELFLRMAATGLTATHALDFSEHHADVLRALDDADELPLFYRCSPVCEPRHTEAERLQFVEWLRLGGKRWQVEGIKFYLDGTIDNGTARLTAPDCYGAGTTSTWHDLDAYRDAVSFFATQGIPTATHAIGDAAVEFALDVLGPVVAASSAAHRVEHVETLSSGQAARFAETGVIASMQPCHCSHFLTEDHSDVWSQRLGRDRALRAFPQRAILAAGGRLALGSDWPIGPFDPREIMASACLRRPPGQPDSPPIAADQAITPREALHAYTRVPAVIGGREADEGSIAVGKFATLTVFAADPLTVTPDQLAGIPIVGTLVHGRFEHRAL